MNVTGTLKERLLLWALGWGCLIDGLWGIFTIGRPGFDMALKTAHKLNRYRLQRMGYFENFEKESGSRE